MRQRQRVNTSITANAQAPAVRVFGTSLTVQLSGTFASHAVVFEASVNSTNGVNGVWVPIQATRTTNIVETATGTLSAAPAYAWELDISGFVYVRFRATSHTSGTAVYTTIDTDAVTTPVQNVTGTVNATMAGQGAEDAAVAGNAVRVGGRCRTGSPSSYVLNDAVDMSMTTAAQVLVKQGGFTETSWNASLALTTTTAQALAAAAGGQFKRHITGVQVINTGAAVVDLIILDGATVLRNASGFLCRLTCLCNSILQSRIYSLRQTLR